MKNERKKEEKNTITTVGTRKSRMQKKINSNIKTPTHIHKYIRKHTLTLSLSLSHTHIHTHIHTHMYVYTQVRIYTSTFNEKKIHVKLEEK